MYTYVTELSLEIPASKAAEVFADLLERYYHHFLPHLYPELAPGSPIQQLVALLKCCGYDALYQEERDVIEIEDCNVEKLNFKEDIVLCVLEGITPAGSLLELYGDDNSQWRIHFGETHKWTVGGKIVFPEASEALMPVRTDPDTAHSVLATCDLTRRHTLFLEEFQAHWPEGTNEQGQGPEDAWMHYQEALLIRIFQVTKCTGLRPQEVLMRFEGISETLPLDALASDHALSVIAAFLQFDQAPVQFRALRNLAPGQGAYSVLGALWLDEAGCCWLHTHALGGTRPFPDAPAIYVVRDEKGYHVTNLSQEAPLVSVETHPAALAVASYEVLYQVNQA